MNSAIAVDVVPMQPHHVDEVAEIELLTQFVDDPLTRFEIAHQRWIARGVCGVLVAVSPNGMVLGFAAMRCFNDCFCIDRLAVHPSCTRVGIGRALFDHVRRLLTAERPIAVMHIRCDDLVAIEFAAEMKFDIVETVGDWHNFQHHRATD